jgi:hypothetical protein
MWASPTTQDSHHEAHEGHEEECDSCLKLRALRVPRGGTTRFRLPSVRLRSCLVIRHCEAETKGLPSPIDGQRQSLSAPHTPVRPMVMPTLPLNGVNHRSGTAARASGKTHKSASRRIHHRDAEGTENRGKDSPRRRTGRGEERGLTAEAPRARKRRCSRCAPCLGGEGSCSVSPCGVGQAAVSRERRVNPAKNFRVNAVLWQERRGGSGGRRAACHGMFVSRCNWIWRRTGSPSWTIQRARSAGAREPATGPKSTQAQRVARWCRATKARAHS